MQLCIGDVGFKWEIKVSKYKDDWGHWRPIPVIALLFELGRVYQELVTAAGIPCSAHMC